MWDVPFSSLPWVKSQGPGLPTFSFPHSDSTRSEATHCAARDDLAAGVSLVVGIDRIELVAIVHHHAIGLLHPVGAGVGQPIDAFDNGAIP